MHPHGSSIFTSDSSQVSPKPLESVDHPISHSQTKVQNLWDEHKWYILALCGIGLLVFLTLLPQISHLVWGDGGDSYQFLGFQYLAKLQLDAGQFPFGHINFWRYPYGFDYQQATDSGLSTLLSIVLYALTDNSTLVYNLTLLMMMWINLIVTYFALTEMFIKRIALVGTIIYGASFYSLARTGGHTNLVVTAGFFCFATVIYLLYVGKANSRRFLVYAFLALFLTSFASLQYPLILIGSLPPLFLAALIVYRKRIIPVIDRQLIVQLLLVFVIFFGCFWLMFGNKLIGTAGGKLQLPTNDFHNPQIIDYLLPNAYLTYLVAAVPSMSDQSIESGSVFLGYIEIVLFIIALGFTIHKREVRFFALSALFFALFALGKQHAFPDVSIYSIVFPIMPYRGIIEPGRFVIPFSIALVMIICYYLQTMRTHNTLLTLIAILLLIERIPYGLRATTAYDQQSYYSYVKSSNTKAVIDLPTYNDWWNGPLYGQFAIYHGKPTASGYIHWSGNTAESKKLSDLLEIYSCAYEAQYQKDFVPDTGRQHRDKILQAMKSYGIKLVVVHKDLHLTTDHCSTARKYLEVFFEDQSLWSKVYSDEYKDIFSPRI